MAQHSRHLRFADHRQVACPRHRHWPGDADLEPIWTKKNETASRVRGRIETILDWARVNGHRTGENPARWQGHLNHLLPARGKVHKVENHPALPWEQIPEFMAELRQQ